MKRLKISTIGCLALAAATALGQASTAAQTAHPRKTSQKTAETVARGQQVFRQNCSRCHQEPEGFSPSISGTIAKHMRVRANLSDSDYKALMKFLNP